MIYDFSSNLIDHSLCQPSFIQYVNELGDFTADFGAKAVIYPPNVTQVSPNYIFGG
jgi:hypothetical protein